MKEFFAKKEEMRMDNIWLLSGIATAIIIIIVLVSLFRKRSGAEDAQNEVEDEQDEPETEPELKRGVLIEKDCFVDKDGTFVPDGANRSRVCFVVKIKTTDDIDEEYIVDEEDYTAVEEGQAVTFMKQGDKFLGFGVDIEEDEEQISL